MAPVLVSVALVLSIIGVVSGARLYLQHNADRCAGGLGRILPGLELYGLLLVALLVSVVPAIMALVVAVRRRHWLSLAWVVGGCALAFVAVGGASSALARTLVGWLLGVGCSWYYPVVMDSLVPLVLALAALPVVFMRARG
jgi:hypothetical protein